MISLWKETKKKRHRFWNRSVVYTSCSFCDVFVEINRRKNEKISEKYPTSLQPGEPLWNNLCTDKSLWWGPTQATHTQSWCRVSVMEHWRILTEKARNHFGCCLFKLSFWIFSWTPYSTETCKSYLESLNGLRSSDKLTDQDIEATEKRVEDFRTNSGPKLQKILEVENEKSANSSFIWKMWTEMYLKDRRPVVITHNPWLSFPLE